FRPARMRTRRALERTTCWRERPTALLVVFSGPERDAQRVVNSFEFGLVQPGAIQARESLLADQVRHDFGIPAANGAEHILLPLLRIHPGERDLFRREQHAPEFTVLAVGVIALVAEAG